jgi:hypothetical protein
MNPDLEKLVRLHHAEQQLKRAEAELLEVPRLRDELDAALLQERKRLDAARAALEASQTTRRQHEAAVQDLEAKRSKYKGQLMEVKTNKEYTAMLHEIEGVEREIRGREDRILEEMEQADTLAGDVSSQELAFREVETRVRKDKAALAEREAEVSETVARLRSDRDEIAASVPGSPLALYQRVARFRGTGVAEARDGMCQGCRVKLRPQMWMELRKNEELMQCEACSRILYYVPPAPAVAPEP